MTPEEIEWLEYKHGVFNRLDISNFSVNPGTIQSTEPPYFDPNSSMREAEEVLDRLSPEAREKLERVAFLPRFVTVPDTYKPQARRYPSTGGYGRKR